jgi:hypothetical protein
VTDPIEGWPLYVGLALSAVLFAVLFVQAVSDFGLEK